MQVSSVGLRSTRMAAKASFRRIRPVNSTLDHLSQPTCSLHHLSNTVPEHASSTIVPIQIRHFHADSQKLAAELISPHVTQAAPLSTDKYHQLADDYLETLLAELEELQEQREEVDVEYSAGVLTLVFPPAGTYVLNKQPPNRQIWLSSPISGPKRYDYVEKEGGRGRWIYLRDGTTLSDVMRKEIGIKLENMG